jgi:hypothetical protein
MISANALITKCVISQNIRWIKVFCKKKYPTTYDPLTERGQLATCIGHIQRTITPQNILQQTFICGGCPNYYADTYTIDRISRQSNYRMSCSPICDVLLVVMKLMSLINLVMTEFGRVWLVTELGKTSCRLYCVSTPRHGFIIFI